ncbi:FAD-dependent oxidoreductase [Albidovulum sp.]|uniref:FAD-dependent oxidoreductase n=1 Tax=Albidovulum sp. TaxID=1872424 RepID=UPI001DB5AD7E|nr:FAD-dependent monooxygenase [Paracoccaceae bacterium]MCC0046750.1 FAD-dependent monooxygenase [Defluviimonas sp.]HPE24963.1 FAD-dependent oxidoreductase [Albidovulum sp.]MCB2122430.1 FAD-dependent monooxygenase [Paracoccaceae bacterium]MCB2139948.1 FAD-dependent monooxygenase [Paracoccaceae bacterium]
MGTRSITVIGAGIAGLAVARALAMRGSRVTVLEQAPEIREVGAGLQITPNGHRVIEALGLGLAAEREGQRAEAVELIDGETGGRVLAMDLLRQRPDAPFRFFHRADLIALLAEGARAAGVEIRLLQRIEEVTLGEGRPRLRTAQGAEIETDILIGADGLHSRVREALNGKVAPFFTHQVAWRATLPAEPDIRPVAQVFMGAGRHVVTYPLRGGKLRNLVAVEERHRWAEESWSLTDDPLALRIAFEDFVPEVRGWLDRIERPNLWGLFRHPVAGRWHGQGAVILGDAAHPTLPFLAQGANMALEDAWVLAHCLSAAATPEAGVAGYQALREARVRRIVAAANANAKNYHLSGIRRDIAHAGLRLVNRVSPSAMLNRFDWLYGHDATA